MSVWFDGVSEIGCSIEAPGFLRFLSRKFDSSKIGHAFLAAYASYLERPAA